MTGWGGPNNRINWDAVITIAIAVITIAIMVALGITIAIMVALGALFAAAMLG